jgi:hypothetical protein
MKPERIQLSRRKGWRMPANTVRVARPGKWGNPFTVNPKLPNGSKDRHGNHSFQTAEKAVDMYRKMLASVPVLADMAREELRGKNLACWCAPGACCHADVLLEIANS